MPEASELFNNENSYGPTSWTSEWINISSSATLTFTSFCSQSYDVGYRLAVDNDFNIIDDISVSKLASEIHEFNFPVPTRFIQFYIANIAAPGSELRTQGFFWTTIGGAPGDGGGGASVTLSNAGAGNSLVSIGVGPALSNKSLTPGTNIVFNDNGTDNITINSTAGGSSVFQQTGGEITPITVTQTTLVGGEGNSVDATTHRGLIWGQDCYTYPTNNINSNVGLIASQNCGVTGPTNGTATNTGCIFSRNCQNVVRGLNGPTEEAGIFCSLDCYTYDDGGNQRACQRSAIIASLNTTLGGDTGGFARDSLQCLIGSSRECEMDNHSGTCCSTILGSNNCQLGTSTPSFADADQLMILGSSGCQLGIIDNESRETDLIISSNGSNITGYSLNATILNCENSTISGLGNRPAIDNIIINSNDSGINSVNNPDGQCTRNTMINSTNSFVSYDDNVLINCTGVTGTHKGNLLASDSISGFVSEADDQCLYKFEGGMKVYSNGALTTGVVLSGGGSSWASVCDKNKKENFVELNYKDILNRICRLPIYQFNYKGNPKEQINYSPIAQDYHSEFMDKLKDGKHTKDQLVIEQMDIIGLCLASIRALKQENDELRKGIKLLNSNASRPVNINQNGLNTLMKDIKDLKDRIKILEMQN